MKKKATENNSYELTVKDQSAFLKPLAPLELESGDRYDDLTLDFDYLQDAKKLTIDFSKIELYDSYLATFVSAIKTHCEEADILLEIKDLNDEAEKFLDAMIPDEKRVSKAPKPPFWNLYFTNIGERTISFFQDAAQFIEFLGELIFKMLTLFVKPKSMRWKDFPQHFMQSGVNAVPITLLILFLIGLISGYQGALQLEQFGADILIADLIGISVTRELAPLMTAILVAGRSGSAFAAEIGAMKVSEEIDALGSMNFDPIKFLVLPRVLSVMIAMPILTLLTDVAGIAGGLVAALTTLNVTVAGYVNELQSVVTYSDVFTGVFKSIVFGFLISTIGCFKGVQVRGGAESVGKFTTSSVVSGIFLIILFDAAFTYIFQILGL